jgi:hypothetical protein
VQGLPYSELRVVLGSASGHNTCGRPQSSVLRTSVRNHDVFYCDTVIGVAAAMESS